MYLKSLTLRGFKSFASATNLKFEPGITCVVGPNGSGKSNVVDALAWVMGEQGAKTLRGGKMDDVIFAGTSSRQALGRAEVSLTIDNTDGAIPIDYTEVTITRTLFRSGGSEYAINGATARLLDIQELLNDSGLGKEMHVIVGQGRLDAILHADPTERRSFIEEAAGVLKHRRRKDKALRKLTGLQTNLDRLADLRAELGRQLGPLGRQAKAARRAATVQAKLRDANARLLADDVVRTQASLEGMTTDTSAATSRRTELEAAIAETEVELTGIDTTLAELETATEEKQRLHAEAGRQSVRAHALARRAADKVGYLQKAAAAPVNTGNASPEQLREQAARAEEEATEVAETVTETEDRLSGLLEKKTALQQDLAAQEEIIDHARRSATELLRRRSALETALQVAENKIQSARTGAEQNTAEIEKLTAELAAKEAEAARAEAAIENVETGETELDEAYEAARAAEDALHTELAGARSSLGGIDTTLAEARARAEALKMHSTRAADVDEVLDLDIDGVVAALADLVTVTPGYEIAVTSALDTAAGAVAVTDLATAVDVLRAVGTDTTVELLVTGSETKPQKPARRKQKSEPAEVSLPSPASALVATADPVLSGILENLLADVVVVADLAAAREVVAGNQLTAVTLTGEILGPHRAARTSSDTGARLAAVHALEETTETIAQLENRREEQAVTISSLETELTTAADATAEALSALHASDARIMAAGEELSRLAGQIAGLRTRIGHAEANTTQLAGRIETARAEHDEAQQALTALDRPVEEVDTTERDRLQTELTGLGEDIMEARIAHRAATDRANFLADRVRALHGRAKAEEAAREQARRMAVKRKEQAASAAEAGEIAGQIAELLDATVAELHTELEDDRNRRTELRSKRSELAEARKTAAAELAKLTDAEHEAQLARERFRLKLEELEHRSRAEAGLGLDRLVDQFGPHLPVPDFEAAAAADMAAEAAVDEARVADDASGGSALAGGGEPAGQTGTVSAEAAVSAVPHVGDLPGRPFVRAELEAIHRKASKELKSIGQVNPLALEEYKALQERHQFLETQIADIEKSRADLMQLVDDVDRHVEEVFAAAFADTAREFEHIFSRLFPGGEGALTLTDPEDMLATGVEVSARPAGKKVKRLSLLSGGERSLVAIAMLVAIFKARPSPFYVMDEVEAALDDLNLSRLLEVFKELQESSQLIIITHQKRTMEIADALYGVTMHGDGVSQVISQRIPQVEAAG